MAELLPEKRDSAEFQEEGEISEAKRVRLDAADAPDTSPGELRIPQQFVGWLKGKGGAQIREIEARSGAQVSIDQTTKELGYSRVVLAGSAEAVQAASDIINDELRRVMERDGLSGQVASPPQPGEDVAEALIPQKYVGWLKGSGGSQIRDMESRTGARVRIDQSTRESGYSVAQIIGTPEAVRQCKAFVEAEVVRVQERDRVVMEHSQQPPTGRPTGFNEVQIPQQYVGWIKGSGGAQIKDIESRTGAHITVDQSTQELGYSRAMVYGPDEAVLAAKQIIQNELARVMDRDRSLPGVPSLGLGDGSLVRTDLAAPLAPSNTAKDALTLLTTLLAAAGAAGSGGTANTSLLADALTLLAGANQATQVVSAPMPGTVPLDPSDTGEWDSVHIPNSCVGWLKGRQGAMIREIESRSGAQVDIDQTTKDMGYSVARMRGQKQQKKVAHGLVVAEVMKVMDQSHEAPVGNFPGMKTEFRIDVQYVGWVKGPRGKVVQDIQVKSGTRIDVDQNSRDLGYAVVKVYGTAEGVRLAKTLIAQELSKITPEVAAQLVEELPTGLEVASQHTQMQLLPQASLDQHAAAAATAAATASLGQYGALGAGALGASALGAAYGLPALAATPAPAPAVDFTAQLTQPALGLGAGGLQQPAAGSAQAATAALQLIASLQQLASVVSQAAPPGR